MSDKEQLNAWNDLECFLQPGERIESIVFGAYGCGESPKDGQDWVLDFI